MDERGSQRASGPGRAPATDHLRASGEHDAAVLAALGARLRARGLSLPALRHCFGVRCAIHAPAAARAGHPSGEPAPVSSERRRSGPWAPPPAALLAYLFVAGDRVDAAAARRLLGDDVDLLADLGLIAVDAGEVQAGVTLLPIGSALMACDRRVPGQRRADGDRVACPDDSAYHLMGVVPPRATRPGLRWLDVGTGAAIVPLARPGTAAAIRATDIHPRALVMARLGVALSGRTDIELARADLLAGAAEHGPWDLITFNAPIPMPAEARGPRYRRGAADVLTRFWHQARASLDAGGPGGLLAPGGEVLAHTWQPVHDAFDALDLPGEVVITRYTPAGHTPAFGVTAWRPDRPRQRRLVHVVLDPERPHLSRAALAPPEAVAGT
ncbi:hypothetical protein [Haliangium sp.]|uniref:hypothetical protein n=1 Tax=Haliangium sp. TaxID=2663208 RepID=UPI003D0B7949